MLIALPSRQLDLELSPRCSRSSPSGRGGQASPRRQLFAERAAEHVGKHIDGVPVSQIFKACKGFGKEHSSERIGEQNEEVAMLQGIEEIVGVVKERTSERLGDWMECLGKRFVCCRIDLEN